MRLSHLFPILGLAVCLFGASVFRVEHFSGQEGTVAEPATQEKSVEKTQEKGAKKGTPLIAATKAFLESLDEAQVAKAVLDFETDQRVQWHFIPKKTRKGLPLTEMTELQKPLAMDVLKAAISNQGFNKARMIMSLESVLAKLEGNAGANERNPEKYYFTIFGKPAFKKEWGLSIEGHHLSLNFVMEGNKIVDSTPQFYATNPAELKEDFSEELKKGLSVLRSEEQLGFALVRSLDDEQFSKAKLPGDVPSEIRAAGEPQPPTERLSGIVAADLNAEQKEALKKLLTAYTSKMKPVVSKERWAAIEESGFDKIVFTWSGAKRLGKGHYYAVQGETFLIEFINVQPDAAGNPANHVHCVWRDMQGDFNLPLAQ